MDWGNWPESPIFSQGHCPMYCVCVCVCVHVFLYLFAVVLLGMVLPYHTAYNYICLPLFVHVVHWHVQTDHTATTLHKHKCHSCHRPSRFCFLDVFKLVSNYMKKMLPKLSFFIIANGDSLTFVHERGSRRMWRTQKTFCLVHLFTNMKICLADLFTKSFK